MKDSVPTIQSPALTVPPGAPCYRKHLRSAARKDTDLRQLIAESQRMKLALVIQNPEVQPTVPVALLAGPFEDKIAKAANLGADGLELMTASRTTLDASDIRASENTGVGTDRLCRGRWRAPGDDRQLPWMAGLSSRGGTPRSGCPAACGRSRCRIELYPMGVGVDQPLRVRHDSQCQGVIAVLA